MIRVKAERQAKTMSNQRLEIRACASALALDPKEPGRKAQIKSGGPHHPPTGIKNPSSPRLKEEEKRKTEEREDRKKKT